MALQELRVYSVSELARETGIPLRTLSGLLNQHVSEIPSVMDGDRRRYTAESIPTLRRLWLASRAGIKNETPAQAKDLHIGAVEKLTDAIAILKKLKSSLEKNPPHRNFFINSFPGGVLQPIRPIAVIVEGHRGKWRATILDTALEAHAESDKEAVCRLRDLLARTFLRFEEQGASPDEKEEFLVLSSLIQRRQVGEKAKKV
jgi:DNA-binding transcriptional MerR regulator